MNETEQLARLHARAEDLYRTALKNGVAAGDFLTPAEKALLLSDKQHRYPANSLIFFGGYSDAERQVPVFLGNEHAGGKKNHKQENKEVNWDDIDWEKDDWWQELPSENEEELPFVPTLQDAQIAVLRLTVPKGADLPDHRATLGTLMAMGLERRTIGDILVQENAVWLFCKSTVCPYLLTSLTKVGKSPVKVEEVPLPADFCAKKDFERVELTLSSLRADAFFAALTGLSRESAKKAVIDGMLKRNHLPFTRPEGSLDTGDLLSVTGKGRYRFVEIAGQTKKGRLKVVLLKYV